MSVKSAISLVARAAAFATLTIGTLAAGLTVTTYTVAKANELMFEQPAGPVLPVKLEKSACV